MRRRISRMPLALGLAAGLLATGCAGKRMVMEVSATILYERPKIAEVTHVLEDLRPGGGAAIVEVAMLGDPGLAATFDIQPGIVERSPMRETADGRYVGSFRFPPDAAGGPYTILVRLRHVAAGEVTARDPELVTIPLAEPSPEP
ncbi:MAG: hypothetical protein HY049_15885 [Acidobacteria bacterium]|nr:hypothetical protein [Acidobacteriota bacterium]